MTQRRDWSVARRLLVLQAIILIALVAAGGVLAYVDASNAVRRSAADRVRAVASTVADSADVRAAVTSRDPTAILQPYAEHVRLDTGVDFITVMNADRIRWTHPDPSKIGQPFLGDTAPSLTEPVFVQTYRGTLGPSVRAVVALRTEGKVRGYVAVGITVSAIAAEVRARIGPLVAVAALVLVIGLVGTTWVSARLRRQTRGLGPHQLSAMFGAYEATLHAISDGLLLLDDDGKVLLCNDSAQTLLGRADMVGSSVRELGLADPLVAAMVGQGEEELHVTESRVLSVTSERVAEFGVAVVLRDHTEVAQLSGELASAQGFTESLRSQAHESANRLHTVVSLVELGESDRAIRFATEEIDLAQRLTDRVVGAVAEPVLAAVLLGKSAQAAERGIDFTVTEDSALPEGVVPARDLVTILGNLIDNAFDAVQGLPSAKVMVSARIEGRELSLRIADNGPGTDDQARQQMFRRGWSTKARGRGLGLALVAAAVQRAGGVVEVTATDPADGARQGTTFVVRLPWAGDS